MKTGSLRGVVLALVVLWACAPLGCGKADRGDEHAPTQTPRTAPIASETTESPSPAAPSSEPTAEPVVAKQPEAAAPAPVKSNDTKVRLRALLPPREEQPEVAAPAMAPPPAPAPTRTMATAPPKPAEGSQSSTESADEAPIVARMAEPEPTDAAIDPADYTVVKVYYGTDRASVALGPMRWLNAVPWGLLSIAAWVVAALLYVVYVFFSRRRTVAVTMVLAMFGAMGLTVCGWRIPHNTKPEEAQTDLFYGNLRGPLELGTCDVSIPKIHEVGELESPSIFRLEFKEDTSKHVVLLGIDRMSADAFYADLKDRVAQSARREAFVFVHGFNVTFEKAARRTAQLAHDLKFDGAPIMFSWPSQGGLLKYTVDENNVAWSVPHLKEFLASIAEQTGAERIHLIAHSMGNRALTGALVNLSYELKEQQTPLFQEVILTAPDIDAEIFCRDIVPAITKTARRVTLYASSNDEALVMSKKIHGYPRAGETGRDNIIVMPGIDTIDVSGADTSLLGHSYYGDSDTVLTDLAQLLREEKPPSLRSRLKAEVLERLQQRLQYWVFLVDQAGRGSESDEL